MSSKTTLENSQNGKKIGLLGGSFNPAHDGHLEMSLFALSRLKLDEVWWLVSPQNPLKSQENMDVLQSRVEGAKRITASHDKIIVTDLERELGTVFTCDSLHAITEKYPADFFVWLMGEDNLASIEKWKSWEEIFRLLPIAVFRRSGYSVPCRQSQAVAKFAEAECKLASVENLAVSPPPAWVVLDNDLNPISATQMRKKHQPN